MDLRLGPPLLLVFSFILYTVNSLEAQINKPYSIGAIVLKSNAAATYTGPIVFIKKSCLTINNGVSIFAKPLNGFFDPNCFVNIPILPNITCQSYPNPVTTNFIIKANNVSTTDETPVWLELRAVDGKFISNQLINIQTLSNGYKMNAAQLGMGIYIVKIFSMNQLITTLKIIKID